MNWQQMVLEFHQRFLVEVGSSPAIREPALRTSLIMEEAVETCEAIKRGDLVESIDGLCDLIYVVLGTAITFGVDLTPFMNAVHRSNMEKVGGKIREDGKILKPDGWTPPDIAGILQNQVANVGQLKNGGWCPLLDDADPCCLTPKHEGRCIASSRLYTKRRPDSGA